MCQGSWGQCSKCLCGGLSEWVGIRGRNWVHSHTFSPADQQHYLMLADKSHLHSLGCAGGLTVSAEGCR